MVTGLPIGSRGRGRGWGGSWSWSGLLLSGLLRSRSGCSLGNSNGGMAVRPGDTVSDDGATVDDALMGALVGTGQSQEGQDGDEHLDQRMTRENVKKPDMK